ASAPNSLSAFLTSRCRTTSLVLRIPTRGGRKRMSREAQSATIACSRCSLFEELNRFRAPHSIREPRQSLHPPLVGPSPCPPQARRCTERELPRRIRDAFTDSRLDYRLLNNILASQLSRSSPFAIAAPMPPSPITVCA